MLIMILALKVTAHKSVNKGMKIAGVRVWLVS